MSLLLGCLILCAASGGDAQQLTVTDAVGREPLEGVLVSAGGRPAVRTGADGRADAAPFAGAASVLFTLSGYDTLSLSWEALSASGFRVSLNPKTYNVREVTVYGMRARPTPVGTAASVTAMPPRDFYRGNDVALEDILNVAAGVRMQTETPASGAAIMIRGMGGSSVLGMRDVRIYYNGLPIAGADGTSLLDDVDFTAFGSGAIIKGPSSLEFGASPAGAVVFDTKKARYREMDLNQIVTAGADGLLRSNTNYRSGRENDNIYISCGALRYGGYRVHSSADKKFVTLSGSFSPSERQTVSVLALASSLDAEIPGEVTSGLYRADPRAANPEFVRRDAGWTGTTVYVGVSHDYAYTPSLRHSLSFFGASRERDERRVPYDEAYAVREAGLRSALTWGFDSALLPLRVSLGGELLYDADTDRRWTIDSLGSRAPSRFDREYGVAGYSAWFGGVVTVSERAVVTAGVRLNGVNEVVSDNDRTPQSDYSAGRRFAPVLSPVLSAVDTLGANLTVYGIVAGGYSPPTMRDLTSDSLAFNAALQAERSIGLEAGVRASAWEGRFRYAVSLFDNEITHCLVPQTRSGIVTLHNAPGARDRGVECSAEYTLALPKEPAVSSIRIFAGGTYSDYRFTDDGSGRRIPGVAPVLLQAGADIASPTGAYLNLTYLYASHRWADDLNSIEDPAYHLFNVRGGWRRRLATPFTLQIYGGIDNLTGALYASALALNPVTKPGSGPAVYNAAPGRVGYLALNVEFHFAE